MVYRGQRHWEIREAVTYYRGGGGRRGIMIIMAMAKMGEAMKACRSLPRCLKWPETKSPSTICLILWFFFCLNVCMHAVVLVRTRGPYIEQLNLIRYHFFIRLKIILIWVLIHPLLLIYEKNKQLSRPFQTLLEIHVWLLHQKEKTYLIYIFASIIFNNNGNYIYIRIAIGINIFIVVLLIMELYYH